MRQNSQATKKVKKRPNLRKKKKLKIKTVRRKRTRDRSLTLRMVAKLKNTGGDKLYKK